MVIGLTGYTGAGKSTVAQIFAAKGAYIIDTDRIARQVVEPGKPAIQKIAQMFGPEVIASDGTLRRKTLGSIVFSDPQKRKQLEQIIHPSITEEVKKQCIHAMKNVVVIDAPVLFEVPDIAALCDTVIFVDAAREKRVQRIMGRDGITKEAALQRVAAQDFMETWQKRCDLVLYNDSDLTEIEQKINLWMEGHSGSYH